MIHFEDKTVPNLGLALQPQEGEDNTYMKIKVPFYLTKAFLSRYKREPLRKEIFLALGGVFAAIGAMEKLVREDKEALERFKSLFPDLGTLGGTTDGLN